jgi:predicted DNA-binding protein
MTIPKTKIREINVHGLIVKEAIEKILDEIETAYFDLAIELKVIHGYNKGVAIKQAINESEEIKNSTFVKGIRSDLTNSGVTIIDLWYHED